MPKASQISAKQSQKYAKTKKIIEKHVKLICTLYVVCMYFVCSLLCSFQNPIQTTFGHMYFSHVDFENYISTTYKVHTNYIQSPYSFRFIDDFAS